MRVVPASGTSSVGRPARGRGRLPRSTSHQGRRQRRAPKRRGARSAGRQAQPFRQLDGEHPRLPERRAAFLHRGGALCHGGGASAGSAHWLANNGSVSHQSMKAARLYRELLEPRPLARLRRPERLRRQARAPRFLKQKPGQRQIGIAHHGLSGDAAAHGIAKRARARHRPANSTMATRSHTASREAAGRAIAPETFLAFVANVPSASPSSPPVPSKLPRLAAEVALHSCRVHR